MNPHVWLRPANVFSWVYVCTFVVYCMCLCVKVRLRKMGYEHVR